MAALRDLDPEAYDALESLGQWRAITDAPDASQDEFWAGVLDARSSFPPEREVDF